VDGPRIQKILEEIRTRDISTGVQGKGQSVWITLGFIKSYSDDAEVNGLVYDRYQEEATVRHFRGFIWTAWEQSKGPRESTVIPSWNRVLYSVPSIYPQLLRAVQEDNAE
jgi:hypothetical protein